MAKWLGLGVLLLLVLREVFFSGPYLPLAKPHDGLILDMHCHVAGIGAGGKGRADISGAANAGCDIVALCDVDKGRGSGMFKAHPKARRFADFRVMLDKMGGSIDACTISTPDHTHAVATSMAMKMGKHCYTQKPLTHDVYEARYLTRLAKRMQAGLEDWIKEIDATTPSPLDRRAKRRP